MQSNLKQIVSNTNKKSLKNLYIEERTTQWPQGKKNKRTNNDLHYIRIINKTDFVPHFLIHNIPIYQQYDMHTYLFIKNRSNDNVETDN